MITSRKEAYTDFIKRETWGLDALWPNYCALPRKEKKRIKLSVQNGCYYNRTLNRVTRFNPKMLTTPVPNCIYRLFADSIPNLPNIGQICRFKRYTQQESL